MKKTFSQIRGRSDKSILPLSNYHDYLEKIFIINLHSSFGFFWHTNDENRSRTIGKSNQRVIFFDHFTLSPRPSSWSGLDRRGQQKMCVNFSRKKRRKEIERINVLEKKLLSC